MNTSDSLITIAAGGILAFVAYKTLTGNSAAAAQTSPGAKTSAIYAKEIANSALPSQPGWGWSYFTDGTAIAPNGDYYSNGVKVWSANP